MITISLLSAFKKCYYRNNEIANFGHFQEGYLYILTYKDLTMKYKIHSTTKKNTFLAKY